jgi:SNW domain-containing protein 1
VEEELEDAHDVASISTLTIKASLPTYGTRKGWRPTSQEHFGDGGSYPECHVAQYPLEMGRKKVG